MKKYWDSFDCQEQCEEVGIPNIGWYDQMMDTIDAMTTEDVLDRCEVVSLDSIKNGSYRMEGVIEDIIDFEWVWDRSMDAEQVSRAFTLGMEVEYIC